MLWYECSLIRSNNQDATTPFSMNALSLMDFDAIIGGGNI